MASTYNTLPLFVKAFDTPTDNITLFVANAQQNTNNSLPLFTYALSTSLSGEAGTIPLLLNGFSGTDSGIITLYTFGDGKVWDSIPLFTSGVPYTTNSITLFTQGERSSTAATLPLFLSNSGIYETLPLVSFGGGYGSDPYFSGVQGGQGQYGSITLFVARDTEVHISSLPLSVPNVASGVTSSMPLYILVEASSTNTSLNLAIPVVYDIYVGNVPLYSHGF